jgi:hypothetical protein
MPQLPGSLQLRGWQSPQRPVRTLQTWSRPHCPHATATPHASATAPHSLFARSQSSLPTTQRLPPASQTKPERHTPQASVPPQPSVICPQMTPAASQVVGAQECMADAPAADGGCDSLPASSSAVRTGAAGLASARCAMDETRSPLQAASANQMRMFAAARRRRALPMHGAYSKSRANRELL